MESTRRQGTGLRMLKSENSIEWDDEFKSFLKEWFSGLMKGVQMLNDETWPNVLEMTGRACAHVHSGKTFWEIWESTRNVDTFLVKINEFMGEKIYKRLDDNTISVSYSNCKCPLVMYGLVDSPLICNCSPNWLIENFEAILGHPVTVTTEHTILRGATSCYFTISY
ncbi:MAG: hypothetical protein JSV04_05620 [Candidatus Heimdallarchaeota archaeon]|nr:MAG: hypothetical protein JSV04_05620 [Candidatus Heimdallarchaeota archaeon]